MMISNFLNIANIILNFLYKSCLHPLKRGKFKNVVIALPAIHANAEPTV